MIFTNKVYSDGDIRDREGFLWFPKTIYGTYHKETRWLQYAKWREKLDNGYMDYQWNAVCWL